MAAVFFTLAGLLEQGDHILACRSLFGSTHQILQKLLPKWGISHTYVDIHSQHTWHKLMQPNTRLVIVETPSNPAVDLIDLRWLTGFCKQHNLIQVVDNCFATPYLQRPLETGADIVTHSGTKFIDGQGRVLGGLISGSKDLIEPIRFLARHAGPALSPFNAWVLSKSLETLAVRMDRHCANALRVAEWLESHPQVARVKYPFLKSHPQYELAVQQMSQGGGVLAFEHKQGLAGGRRFLDALQMLSLSANLGDTRTIATHPASTTHAKQTEDERLAVGITPGLIRIAVGLENANDIIADLAQALDRS
jgi:O-succinylhomoserine sulfhydrylase